MNKSDKDYVLPVVTNEETLSEHRRKKFLFIKIAAATVGITAFCVLFWLYHSYWS